MTDRNLLLVDTRVEEYPQIVAAINASTIAVTFDPSVDSYASLLEKIAAQGVSSFESVGVVQHGSPDLSTYRILDSDNAVVLGVETTDPDLASWEPIATFFQALATNYQIHTVDLLACALYANPGIVYALTRLDERLGVRFRASTDNTGNTALAANWTMESDNVNVKDVYFTEAIEAYMHRLIYLANIPFSVSYNTMINAQTPIIPMISATNPVQRMMERDPSNCYLSVWDSFSSVATTRALTRRVIPDVKGFVGLSQGATVSYAHLALKNDDSAVVWGNPATGNALIPTSADDLIDISDAVGTANELVILYKNGSLRSFSGILANRQSIPSSTPVKAIATNMLSGNSFAAIAIFSDETVKIWGANIVNWTNLGTNSGSFTGVKAIATNGHSFAGLRGDGSVVTVGSLTQGGDTTSVANDLSGIVAITPGNQCYAALRNDGRVITWGSSSWGGNSSDVSGDLSGITHITSSNGAFAALRNDGRVITWGGSGGGDSSSVKNDLVDVIAIAASYGAFAALRSDGRVITWGNTTYASNSSTVQNDLSGVVSLVPTIGAFAALRSDNRVITWGNSTYGADSSSVSGDLSEIVSIAANSTSALTRAAFTAIRSDGRLVTWGVPSNSTNVADLSHTFQSNIKRTGTIGGIGFGAFLTAPTVPDAPSISISVAASQVTLSWLSLGDGGSPITSYKVYNDSDVEITSNVSVDLVARTATVTGLDYGTRYSFKVSAVNAVGESPKSNLLYNIPSEPRITNVLYNTGLIQLSITAPLILDGGVTSYTIYNASNVSYATIPGVSIAWSGINPPTSNTSVTTARISGLTNGEAYSLYVKGLNAMGETAPSTTVTETPRNAPNAPPGFGTTITYDISGESRIIQFTPTAPATISGTTSQTVTDYRVYYVNGSTDIPLVKNTNFTLNLSTRLVTVRSIKNTVDGSDIPLAADTPYTFKASAFSANGEGKLSPATSEFIHGDSAQPPTNIVVTNTSRTTSPVVYRVSIAFTPPTNNGGRPITGYDVSAVATDLTSFQQSNMVATQNTILFPGLTPGKTYTFRISTRNGTNTVRQQGVSNTLYIPPVLNPPTNVTAIQRNRKAVVSWTLPTLPAGTTPEELAQMPTGYTITGSPHPVSVTINDGLATSGEITGLLPNINYTFTVTANNLSGLSDPSAKSVAIKPYSTFTILQAALAKPGSKVTNVKSDIASLVSALPSADRSPILNEFAQTVVEDTALTLAEKVLTLVQVANTMGQTSVSDKAAAAAAIQANQTLQGSKTSLDSTQTTALLASGPTVGTTNVPSTLSVVVPVSNAVTLTENDPVYVVMTPDTAYTINVGSASKTITYNSSLNKLVCEGVNYAVGDSIPLSNTQAFRIFATGSAGGIIESTSGITESTSGIPCFPAGVMIRTPDGEKAVETLKTGDLVVTAAGRIVPIRMHSYSLETTTKATAPYFIPAGALGPKAPAKPLHLSPLHAFQVRPNVWWCAQQAAKVSPKIQQYAVGESITYYHVECPNFLRDNLVADGVVVESFAGKQLTVAESRNIYKFNKEVGGYVRSAPARAIAGSSST